MIDRLFANGTATFGSIICIVMLLLALLLIYRTIRLLGGARADGVIVDYHSDSDGETFAPIVRFTAGVHGERTFRSQNDSGLKRRGPVGGRVRVLYDPDRPDRADIAPGARVWLGILVLLIMSGAGLLLALRSSD